MTDGKRKLEPPLKLDMDFGEALRRFAVTDPKQVRKNIERSKQKRPALDEAERRPQSSRKPHQRGGER